MDLKLYARNVEAVTRKVKGVDTPGIAKGGVSVVNPLVSNAPVDAQSLNSWAKGGVRAHTFFGEPAVAEQLEHKRVVVFNAIRQVAIEAKLPLDDKDNYKLSFLKARGKGAAKNLGTPAATIAV